MPVRMPDAARMLCLFQGHPALAAVAAAPGVQCLSDKLTARKDLSQKQVYSAYARA